MLISTWWDKGDFFFSCFSDYLSFFQLVYISFLKKRWGGRVITPLRVLYGFPRVTIAKITINVVTENNAN